jgi:solute carrier family 35 (adenosine 3'-phospho 5'-phosphosulfate transporter), member B3
MTITSGSDSGSSRIRVLLQHDLLLPAVGMFIGYICHDALQERMFRFPGFEFGWFMTLAEVTIMLIGGLLANDTTFRPDRSTILASSLMGLCIAVSHGCGNTALRYTTYPLKVAFKSCKLIPTMWLGLFITKRSFPWNQYIAASIMCAGLVLLTLADRKQTHNSTILADKQGTSSLLLTWIGPMLLCLSTTLDSIVPNLQERLFATTDCSTNHAMFLCNTFMFILSLLYTIVNGELLAAVRYCSDHPWTLAVLFGQSLSAYMGLQCYLTVVSRHGGVAAVLMANIRKLITIGISFLLFAKPCSKQHLVGLTCMVGGVYLGVSAKHRQGKLNVGKKLDVENIHPSHNGNHSHNGNIHTSNTTSSSSRSWFSSGKQPNELV